MSLHHLSQRERVRCCMVDAEEGSLYHDADLEQHGGWEREKRDMCRDKPPDMPFQETPGILLVYVMTSYRGDVPYSESGVCKWSLRRESDFVERQSSGTGRE